MSSHTDLEVRQWLLEHREEDGDLPIQRAIRVGRQFGVEPRQVFRVADQIRGETTARLQSGFPSGTYDLMMYAHRWGHSPENMDKVLGTPDGAFRDWCTRYGMPLPDSRYTGVTEVTKILDGVARDHPDKTVWEHAGLQIPDALRPENWQEQGHATHGQKGVDFGA